LRSILEEERALQNGIALFKTDTDGMDAFILQEFLKLEQRDTALFFECDVRQTILEGRAHATWHSVFGSLRERGYSLIVFDNFGYQIASCSPERYDLVGELIAYVEAQFSHQDVHVYYLDVWAFPPAMATIFERCRTHAFAPLQPGVEPHVRQRQWARQQLDLTTTPDRSGTAFAPSGCTSEPVQSKWRTDSTKFEAQVIGGGALEEWSYYRAQISDLHVDLSRASKTIQDQRRVIELLSANLSELKQKSSQGNRRSRAGWRSAGFWKSLKK
jgi:hypothetical protein